MGDQDPPLRRPFASLSLSNALALLSGSFAPPTPLYTVILIIILSAHDCW